MVLVVAALLAVSARYAEIWYDSQYRGERGPYLQRTGPTAASIHWQTAQQVLGSVRYREVAGPVTTPLVGDSNALISSAAQPQTRHHHRLQHLTPGQTYEYAVFHDGELSAGPYRFRTWPGQGEDPQERLPGGRQRAVRVWALGDPGLDSALAHRVRHAALQWLMGNPRPDARDTEPPALPALLDVWLTTGDNAYRSGRNREYQAALFQPYQAALAHYALFPAYGNHDARRWAFFDIFDLPARGESGGVASHSEHYYALDYGPLHVVMLDSQDSEISADSPMLQWLRRDLAARRARWTLAVFHHPPYSRGSHDSDDDSGSDWRMRAMREVVVPVLEAYAVDVVLTGHSHAYERSHLITGHYGLSDDFAAHHVVDDGGNAAGGPGQQYRQRADCTTGCGTLYIVLGNSAKLTPGSLDHPALPVAMLRGGSLVLDVAGPCLYGYMIADDYSVADRFSIARGAATCAGMRMAPAP